MRFFNRFRVLGLLTAVVGAAMILVGCNEQDAAQVKASADAAVLTGNPLLVGIGTLVSIISSHFISKANDVKADAKDWTADDVAAMARGLESQGYTLTKKP